MKRLQYSQRWHTLLVLRFNIHQEKPCVHGAKGVWTVLRAHVWVQRLLLPHKNGRNSNIWRQKSGMEMNTRHRFCVGDTSAFLLCVRLARKKIDTWLWCHKKSPPLPPFVRFIHRCIDEWIDKLIIRALLSLDSSAQTFVSVVERERNWDQSIHSVAHERRQKRTFQFFFDIFRCCCRYCHCCWCSSNCRVVFIIPFFRIISQGEPKKTSRKCEKRKKEEEESMNYYRICSLFVHDSLENAEKSHTRNHLNVARLRYDVVCFWHFSLWLTVRSFVSLIYLCSKPCK